MIRFENDRYEALNGSRREPVSAHAFAEIADNALVEVTLHLRRKQPLNFEEILLLKKFLSRDEFEECHGANFADILVVFEFAHCFGLGVQDVNVCARTIQLFGTAARISSAFKVKLVQCRKDGKTFHTHKGSIFLPAELAGIVTAVFGLDNRPLANPHFRVSKTSEPRLGLKPDGFDGNQLAQIYNFPPSAGAGQTIALIELGGGYLPSETATYFAALNLPVPVVKSVSVQGAQNTPGLSDADIEVALDIEVAGAVAPQAAIVVYFAPNTDQGFLQAILACIHDTVNKPQILSISWGAAESAWTAQQMQGMNEAFQSAAAIGMSVLVACGDDGVNDNVDDGKAHVDFPASSPAVTACGGTSLVITNGERQESVWNDGDNSATGGGISSVFDRPVYQQHISMPPNLNGDLQGRGLPDVSAVADPATGYSVFVHGTFMVVGGTSAVAPLMAGLLARINALAGKPSGLINTVLYNAQAANGFNDIVGGNNTCDGVTGYTAVVGWDPVTGFGSPDGVSLQKLLSVPNS